MENKETFDAVAREYDRFRPAYPNELFSDIIDYSGIHQADQILEIGCGTGQATTGFIRLGYRHMTCVELGKRLAQIACSINAYFPWYVKVTVVYSRPFL